MSMDVRHCLDIAVRAALDAGQAILDVYGSEDFRVEYKGDESPLTLADRVSHAVIQKALCALPYPVLSEEGRDISFDERKDWNPLWIVDPLDGTKEFIKRNGEFTVNIALVCDQTPVCGVVYVPVTGVLYFGGEGLGSWQIEGISVYTGLDEMFVNAVKLPRKIGRDEYVVMGSRSHGSSEFEVFVDELRSRHAQVEVVSAGSSLKICKVADGSADIYPRLGPTREWDTAAGHAVVKYAGKKLVSYISGLELRYNKADVLNEWFVVK